MSALAVRAMKAIMRNLGPLDEDSLADEPEDLRRHIFDVEAELREAIEEEADEAGAFLWEGEVEKRLEERRLAYWNNLMSDEESLEVAMYLINEALPALVNETVEFLDMVCQRQPGLIAEVTERRAALAAEIEVIFADILADAQGA